MTHIEQCSSYASSPRSAASLRHLYNVWRSRRALAALDDAALKDVGLTRHDATREAARPFWDAPNTWRM
ncbi:DUF1127 domain-containing protein [Ascidiaceihabitans sp.]|nr:DUF1127 domain-containing protein [Ascidiaceihabitans sp.]